GARFAIVFRDGAPPVGRNASGRSPARPGDALPELFGPRSVTVPGCVAGWTDWDAGSSRRGVAAALAPAIALAVAGWAVPPKGIRDWAIEHAALEGDAAEHFAPRDPMTNPQIAIALEHAVAGTFYEGRVAEAVASVSWLEDADLASH